MKPTKLILTFSVFCALVLWCSGALVPCAYAAGEDITVSGDTQAQTVSLADTTLPASGSEGEIRYNTTDDKLYVWDGTGWKLLSTNKNVATKIVGTKNLVDPTKASLDYNRADYICDGTDDQQEINQAINEVANVTINPTQQGVVYLLNGTYNISAALLDGMTTAGIVLKSGISLIGAGRGTALNLTSGTSNVNVINASSVNRILISQLMIDGNSNTGSNNNGIKFTSVTYSKIAQVGVENMSLHGISFDAGNTDNTLSDNLVQSNGAYGIYLSGSSKNIISANIVRLNVVYGIYLSDQCDNNILSGNTLQLNAAGIVLGLSDNNILSGNSIQSSGGAGIYSTASNNNILSGNSIQSNTGGAGIYYDSSDNNILSGNSIQSNAGGGIVIFRSSNNNIIANNISDNGNGYSGIKIDFDSDNNLISSNYIYDASDATDKGIDVVLDPSSFGNYLAANYISGFPINISDSGANTKYTGKEKITLEQGTHSATTPSSYMRLSSGSPTIANGKSTGDILILEGPSSGTAVPTVANLKLCNDIVKHPNHDLSANDTLSLIWNAAASAWLELSYTNN